MTNTSLISAGTERMLVEFGRANLIDKVRQQPDKVKQVIQKIGTDGVSATLEAVRSKLDQPIALGYCNVGRVVEIGKAVAGYSVGERVISNGAHAELVAVPRNLCARVPDEVSDDTAAFTVVAAIGLQGIRLADPKIGECVAVIGLGLIGLLTVQMLQAQGCRVLGIDFDETRLSLARRFGVDTVSAQNTEEVLARAFALSRGLGVDAVIITASTKSNEPVSQAAKMCRKRGRVVLVGAVGLELSRADFYEKELTFQVSCSYGPGRYDPAYEENGNDYPAGYVRWTEQRNFEAVLNLMAAGAIDVTPLITHRFPIERASDAFELLTSREASLGILLNFNTDTPSECVFERTIRLSEPPLPSKGTLIFLGAGNYAGRVLIPAFEKAGAQLRTVASAGGISAVHFGKKHGFSEASTDDLSAIRNTDSDAVVIATRHNAHARQVLSALRAGKHVFCEKPLCLTLEELAEIEAEALSRPTQHLMVGFNRRFAPLTMRAKSILASVSEPMALVLTVNAGDIPASHWTQNAEIGGGRIIGEACHFIDLLRHLAGAPIISWQSNGLKGNGGAPQDTASVLLSFQNGSHGTVHYLANGHKSFPKERVEVFASGRVLQIDNFRTLRAYGFKEPSRTRTFRQDKGQVACATAFIKAIRCGAPTPIPLAEIIEVSRVSIEAAMALE